MRDPNVSLRVQCPVCCDPVPLEFKREALHTLAARTESSEQSLDVVLLMASLYCPGRRIPGHIGAKEAHA